MQVTADYSQPNITTKASVAVSKKPVVDVSLATGYSGFVLGASGRVDVMSSALSNTLLAASYIGPDYVASAHTDFAFKKIRGAVWQQLDAASSVAAEVVHDTAADDVMLTMGYCHAALDGACAPHMLSTAQ